MKGIVETLVNRDGISEAEAQALYNDTYDEVMMAIECGDFDWAEDILASDLGLEPDYFDDMFF